jgi:hypothetical protein
MRRAFRQVPRDELLRLFANMPDDHPRHVAICWPVFKGPSVRTKPAATARWSQHLGLASRGGSGAVGAAIGLAADDAGLPRTRVQGRLRPHVGGARIALANSSPGAALGGASFGAGAGAKSYATTP